MYIKTVNYKLQNTVEKLKTKLNYEFNANQPIVVIMFYKK